jgi:hypothetical protein
MSPQKSSRHSLHKAIEPALDLHIRPAGRDDAELLFGLIEELADYETLSEAVKGNAELLATTLFDDGGGEALASPSSAAALDSNGSLSTGTSKRCASMNRPGPRSWRTGGSCGWKGTL